MHETLATTAIAMRNLRSVFLMVLQKKERKRMRYQKKWRVTAALLAAALAASCVTGCSGGQENAETAGNTEAEGSKGTEGARTAESGSSQSAEAETRDSVVVVMGPTSEPEAGFDPAYGWGAGDPEHSDGDHAGP